MIDWIDVEIKNVVCERFFSTSFDLIENNALNAKVE